MQLTFEKPYFFCKAAFAEREAPKKAGFRFDARSGRFFTSDIQVASRLRKHADQRTRKVLSRFLIDVEPWTGRIRHPKGLKPRRFQVDAARFLLERNRSYLNGAPGVGKTIIASLVMNATPRTWVVYLCPPFLALNVKAEIEKWTMPKRQVKIQGRDEGLTRGVWIIPDSLLSRDIVHQKLEALRYHAKVEGAELMLIVDEAHRFKSEKSGRALYVMEGFVPRFPKQVWMSGTPMENRPLELYPVLSRCAPETIDFMDRFQFGLRYCGGRRGEFGWDFRGASHVEELANKVIGTFMYRIKKEVLELEPLREELILIGENMSPALCALDRALLKEFSPEDLMGYLAPNAHVSTYRKELGKLKARAALPYLKSFLDDTDEPMIVSTVHREVIAYLKEHLAQYDPAIIDGSVASDKRVGIAKAWQDDPKRKLVLINNVAGGIGLNLQKATRVILVEFDWVYAKNLQIFDRAHRFGQMNTVVGQYLVYKNSIDRKVIEAVLRKKALSQHI